MITKKQSRGVAQKLGKKVRPAISALLCCCRRRPFGPNCSHTSARQINFVCHTPLTTSGVEAQKQTALMYFVSTYNKCIKSLAASLLLTDVYSGQYVNFIQQLKHCFYCYSVRD